MTNRNKKVRFRSIRRQSNNNNTLDNTNIEFITWAINFKS